MNNGNWNRESQSPGNGHHRIGIFPMDNSNDRHDCVFTKAGVAGTDEIVNLYTSQIPAPKAHPLSVEEVADVPNPNF
jgi:hypothetical protein